MKKIFIISILSILSIFIIAPPIYAATTTTVLVEEPAANAGGLWHVEDGNRAYIFMRYLDGDTVDETGISSNQFYPEYDFSLYTKWGGFHNDLEFPNTSSLKTATISNPNPTLYDKFVIKMVSHMFGNENSPPTFKTIATYESVVDQIEINLYDYDDNIAINGGAVDDYSYITLSVDGEEVLSSRNTVDTDDYCWIDPNPYTDDRIFAVQMYWEKSETAGEINPGDNSSENPDSSPWDALPDTTGSPSNPVGDWGSISNIQVINQNISFDINYLGNVYVVNPFIVEGDLSFINKANDILYYTDPESGDRMLYFNFGDTLDSALLTVRSFSEINEWKGEALWNLSKNEIKVTDLLNVYNYIPEVDSDGNVYSYFYMPNVPIDDLISVSTVLAYKFFEKNIWGNIIESDIQYKTVAAVKGELNTINPSWVEKTYRGAYITGATMTTIMAAGTLAGATVPVYGWAVAGAFFLAGAVLQVADVNEWFAYDVEQIEHVIPDAALSNEINTYISEVGGDDSFSVDTDKLYKLHLADLDYDNVQVIGNLSNVTQVVWETDGKIYVVNQDNIEKIDWGGPGTLEPDVSSFLSLPTEITWIIIGIAGIYLIDKMDLFKKPGLLIIIAAITIYILNYLGIITWFQ